MDTFIQAKHRVCSLKYCFQFYDESYSNYLFYISKKIISNIQIDSIIDVSVYIKKQSLDSNHVLEFDMDSILKLYWKKYKKKVHFQFLMAKIVQQQFSSNGRWADLQIQILSF